MGTGRGALAFLAALGLGLACAGPAALHAVEPVMELKWDQLVPPAPPKRPKAFFADRPGDDSTTAPSPQLPEGLVGEWLAACLASY